MIAVLVEHASDGNVVSETSVCQCGLIICWDVQPDGLRIGRHYEGDPAMFPEYMNRMWERAGRRDRKLVFPQTCGHQLRSNNRAERMALLN